MFADHECLSRWTTMKDYYVRTKKKAGTGSGAVAKQRMERLSFLDGTTVIHRKWALNHIPIPCSISHALLSSMKANYLLVLFLFYIYINRTITNVSEDGASALSVSDHDYDDDDTFSVASSSENEKKRKLNSTPAMIESLNDNREQRHKQKMEMIQKMLESSKPTQPDGVDLFMQSIAASIKHFPKQQLAQVKLNILQIVTEMEAKIAVQADLPVTSELASEYNEEEEFVTTNYSPIIITLPSTTQPSADAITVDTDQFIDLQPE